MVSDEERQALKEELKKEIQEENKAREEEIKKAKSDAKRKAKEIRKAAEKARKEEEERLKASDEPWVTITGNEDKEQPGIIKVEIDWNDAFIKLLRKNGYKGTDDETIIQHYLAVISKRAAGDLADDQISEFV